MDVVMLVVEVLVVVFSVVVLVVEIGLALIIN